MLFHGLGVVRASENIHGMYMAETGAQTTVDSVMALGHAMSKNYATLAPKVEGRVARYSVQVVGGGDE